MNKVLSKLYDSMKQNKIIASVIAFLYIKKHTLCAESSLKEVEEKRREKGSSKIKIAVISDEMTWQNLQDDFDTIFLTPKNWRQALGTYQPDFLFCESAWSGLEKYKHCWRLQIYKSEKYIFNNRKTLFQILEDCKRHNITTVFWNKEDPFFFNHKDYNFSDTALSFDQIYTTAVECVARYVSLGHKQVDTLMFGYNPRLFFPPIEENRENIAVFAGSWYGEQKERCHDLSLIFDEVLKRGIPLHIYDRQWQSAKADFEFPEKYRPFVKKGISYEKLGAVYRQARYVINVNTVKESKTMFARRVFEAMACGAIVISNESQGLREIFSERIWFIGSSFHHEKEEAYRRVNIEYVQGNQTIAKSLKVKLEALAAK